MKKQNKSIEPYPASWIHRFTGWVDAIFIPSWMFYTGLFLLTGLIVHLVRWQEGVLQLGTIEIRVFLVFLLPYGSLALHHYLESASRDALRDTRPMLGVTDDEFLKLEYEFRVMPVRQFRTWSLVGFALGVLMFFSVENIGVGSLYGITAMLSYGLQGFLTIGFYYRVIRMLRMIDSLYASASNIGLFMLSPVYAFSTLSAKVGVSSFLLLFLSAFIYPEAMTEIYALAGIIMASSVPLAAFFLPLRGINRRLVDEKQRLQFDVSQRLEFILGQIKHTVEAGDLKKIGDLETALRAVRSEKDLVDKIPTWPWRPATIRAFLSAVFLPIFLWLIQQILDRFLDF